MNNKIIKRKINYLFNNYIISQERNNIAIINKNNIPKKYIILKENLLNDSKEIEKILQRAEDFIKEFSKSIDILIYFSQLQAFTYKQLDRICKNEKINLLLIDNIN